MTDWNDFRACIYEGGHGFTDRDIIDRANEEINDLRARAEKAEAALAATVAEAEAQGAWHAQDCYCDTREEET